MGLFPCLFTDLSIGNKSFVASCLLPFLKGAHCYRIKMLLLIQMRSFNSVDSNAEQGNRISAPKSVPIHISNIFSPSQLICFPTRRICHYRNKFSQREGPARRQNDKAECIPLPEYPFILFHDVFIDEK